MTFIPDSVEINETVVCFYGCFHGKIFRQGQRQQETSISMGGSNLTTEPNKELLVPYIMLGSIHSCVQVNWLCQKETKSPIYSIFKGKVL